MVFCYALYSLSQLLKSEFWLTGKCCYIIIICIKTRFQANAFSLYFGESIEKDCIKCEKKYMGGELPAIHPDVVELAFKRSLGCLQCHLMLGDRHPGTRAGALSSCWQHSFSGKPGEKGREQNSNCVSPSCLTNQYYNQVVQLLPKASLVRMD